MNSTITKYLACHAAHDTWPLTGACDSDALRIVVVIPALAESRDLFSTLASLGSSSASAQAATLVICVVNNHAAGLSPEEDIKDNAATLHQLRTCISEGRYAPMRLAVVDAASQDRALPAGEGVGLARKIGLDHGLCILASAGKLDAPLVCLDADSPAAPGYLDGVRAFYEGAKRWAGYTAYLHRFPERESEREAIVAYEIYMRYHELGLRRAGSPYAYPALGSIISCTAEAYAACGGMNRRCAGEDFYFMQQLTKTGPMEPVPGALVYPSGRSSCRTPFGTGRSVEAFGQKADGNLLLYHPDCYNLLREFFGKLQDNNDRDGASLLAMVTATHPELARFLHERGFERVWEGLLQRYRKPEHRLHQFHVWFDGLRTIQFIHRLRKTSCPDLPASEALAALKDWLPEDTLLFRNLTSEVTLEQLRQIGLRRYAPLPLPDETHCPDFFLRLPATS